jgi:hypothetical protein
MMTSDDTPYDLPDGVPHQMMAGLLSFEASLALCDELLGGAVLGGAVPGGAVRGSAVLGGAVPGSAVLGGASDSRAEPQSRFDPLNCRRAVIMEIVDARVAASAAAPTTAPITAPFASERICEGVTGEDNLQVRSLCSRLMNSDDLLMISDDLLTHLITSDHH